MAGDFNLLEAVRAVFASELSSTEKLVALALLNHWSRDRETFPSTKRLAKWTSLCTRSVLRSVAALEARGAIAVTRSNGRANRYSLGALMSVTSDSESPVTDSHPCPTVTGPVTLSHSTSDTESHEVIQGRDPSKGSRKRARASAPRGSKDPVSESPEEAAQHKQLTKLYFESYEAARGSKPPFDSLDGKAVKDLLAKCGPEVAASAIQGAFNDDWWRGKTTIRDIAKEPAKFVGVKPAKANGRGPKQPNGGSWKPVVES